MNITDEELTRKLKQKMIEMIESDFHHTPTEQVKTGDGTTIHLHNNCSICLFILFYLFNNSKSTELPSNNVEDLIRHVHNLQKKNQDLFDEMKDLSENRS